MHPRGAALKGWEQDQLILETIAALNATYRSPYRRRLELPLHEDAPPGRREGLQQRLASLNPDGVPDTVAYVTEEEALAARGALEGLGYDWADVEIAFTAPPQPVDYQHFFCRR